MEAFWSRVEHLWLAQRAAAFRALPLLQQTYLLGLLTSVLCLVAMTAGADVDAIAIMLWVPTLLLSGAIAVECYGVAARYSDRLWLKWLTAPLIVMLGAFGWGAARSLLNEATGQDPELFPLAVVFMAPVAVIPAVALVMSVCLAVAAIAMFFIWMLVMAFAPARSRIHGAMWIWRACAAIAAISLISPLVSSPSAFATLTRQWAATMAQGLDMHADPTCGPRDWDRVRRISDELVLVATRTTAGPAFRRVACPLAAD